MSPSWYDLLDVPPDATTDEVRAAWRAQLADLDPTDRRFAVLNEAAAVLLDPERRAAHDAELAGRTAHPSPTSTPTPAAASPVDARVTPDRRQPVFRRRTPSATAAATGTTETTQTVETTGPDADTGTDAGTRRRRVPAWVPFVLGVLTAAVLATTFWVAATVPADDDVLAGTRTAQSTAERAVVPLLSYDHRTLEEDRAAALPYLSDDFREDYEQLFTQIEENAPATRTVVQAEVRASSITRGGEDRVQVLVFVDQLTTNAQTSEPVTYRNQVTVTMERDGDDWLVDDLRTTRG
ncbi:DnaJ domain-containing protein [Nocardioides sp. SOB77]|uniref:DnaJ domain-containing protein n=1 Tax=Nocardioides oceani TaxID=3058369 RepID=A0ABT8FAD7_9ACTN|nr:DnaJ domain-containing protein [Nocardioides oceani]MDN4171646.1 DnaJ domain-containing protein [Nocardioides oceani]